MGRAAPLLLVLVLAACERDNPLYCDEVTSCAPGLVCRLPARRCVEADAGGGDEAADMAAAPADEGSPDLRTSQDLGHPLPDMVPGLCTSDSRCGTGSGLFCDPKKKMCVPCDTADHCGATVCYVCAGSDDSAQPACQGRRCVCTKKKDCNGDECVMGTCYRGCGDASGCMNAPMGAACVMGMPFPHCGCASDAQCPMAGTRCELPAGICKCGGTLCKDGQMCRSGVCGW